MFRAGNITFSYRIFVDIVKFLKIESGAFGFSSGRWFPSKPVTSLCINKQFKTLGSVVSRLALNLAEVNRLKSRKNPAISGEVTMRWIWFNIKT